MAKTESIPRQKMPEQDPAVRSRNFEEVTLGYTMELAQKEASRCLQCKKPACMEGCPVSVNIPGFIAKIAEGDMKGAIDEIWKKNALPAICGRVCPQEIQCEGKCLVGKKDKPVAIGQLEMFCADYARKNKITSSLKKEAPTGKKVAVIGSGPAGLTVAGDLIMKGHSVTIYEAFHKAGGVLVYGIPEFRLPKEIVQYEVDGLKGLGVDLKCNNVVGASITVDELFKEGYDAMFLGLGAGLPVFMSIEGENLIGVFSANEYLTRTNLMKAYLFPKYDTPIPRGKNVVVFGGGNVAMDAARTAMRLGADKTRIVYRRSREELPARAAEIHHAEEEGLEFQLLTAPVKFVGDEKGILKKVVCLKMELGEPDASGRRSPIPIKGSEFEIDCDLAVIAIGSNANPLLTNQTPDIKLNRRGYIVANPAGKTSKKAVWAAGDIVTGQATVILAMGQGRVSADSMDEYLKIGW